MPTPKIQDEFTDLPVSRQTKYQLRNSAKGLCARCGKPTFEFLCCIKCRINERRRYKPKRKRYKPLPGEQS